MRTKEIELGKMSQIIILTYSITMVWKKKPRVLKRKNIKRRTGAKAQATQIAALSKQITGLTKTNYERVRTVWTRNEISVDSLLPGSISAYVCPLPKTMCNCYEQPTIQNQALTEKRIGFSDNLALAAQPIYYKTPIFNASAAAQKSPEATHTGGILHWRLTSEEPNFSTYSIFVVSPKKRQADQLITDRALKGFGSAGAGGKSGVMYEKTDFVTHPNIFVSEFNKKYWNVRYHREVNFSHPNSTAINTNVNPANTNTKNNAVIQTGKYRLKPGGQIKCFNVQQPAGLAGQATVSASQLGIEDERCEDMEFLVIVNNGVSADLQTVNLSLLVKDEYKMVV